MRRTRIADRRGAIHRICRPEDLPDGASGSLRAMVKAANRHRPMYYLPMGVGLAAGVVGGTLLRRSVDYLTVSAMAGSAFASGAVFSLLGARRRARQAAEACLEAGLCAACGYPMAGNEAGADGCVICPECGAAWRTATG